MLETYDPKLDEVWFRASSWSYEQGRLYQWHMSNGSPASFMDCIMGAFIKYVQNFPQRSREALWEQFKYGQNQVRSDLWFHYTSA